MQISFNNRNIGFDDNFYLDKDVISSFTNSVSDILEKVPRTNYMLRINSFINPKIWAIRGTLVGSDQDDYRDKKLALVNEVGREYEFTITDKYNDANGTETLYGTYYIQGLITDVQITEAFSNMCRFQILISSEDPHIYGDEIVGTADISRGGFIFPLFFPFIFSGANNQLVITNAGQTVSYPQIKLTGGFENLTIQVPTSDEDLKAFTITRTVATGDYILISPNPKNEIKIVDSLGNNISDTTTRNFETLKVQNGDNTFIFLSDGGLDSSTEVELTYRPAYKGI
jgi:hypothetical protein